MNGAVVSLIASLHDDYSGDLANSTLYGLGGISEAIATTARSGVQSAPALYEGVHALLIRATSQNLMDETS